MRWPKQKKREGKYTVGLINKANDCFANSNLQALGALQGLYEYASRMATLQPPATATASYQALVANTQHDDTEKSIRRSAAANLTGPLEISIALRNMIVLLNEPILDQKDLDPWIFLKALERFYNSLISRSQHDAHELLHLVLETLETEHSRIKRYYVSLREAAAKQSQSDTTSSSIEYLDNLIASIPRFPFKGHTRDQITCSRCGYIPNTSPSSFIVLSLMVPQKSRATLTDLLVDFGAPEFIQDYGCARCRVSALVQRLTASIGAPSTSPQTRETQTRLLEELRPFVEDPDKLPAHLEAHLPRDVTSPIAKSTQFHALPEILAIHLSRSIYAGYGASRNSCKVSVPEYLELMEDFPAQEEPVQGESVEDKIKSLLGGKRAVQYVLVAMIRHKGTHYAGHYECYRRKNLPWWKSHLPFNNVSATRAKPAATNGSSAQPGRLPTRPVTASATGPAHARAPATASSSDSKKEDTGDDESGEEDYTSVHRLPYPQEQSSSISPAEISNKTHTHDAMSNGGSATDLRLTTATALEKSDVSGPAGTNGTSDGGSQAQAPASAASSATNSSTSKSSSSSWTFSFGFLGGGSSAVAADSADGRAAPTNGAANGKAPSSGSPPPAAAPSLLEVNGTAVESHADYEVLPPSTQYTWWQISDEKVWEKSMKDVLKEESGAYLLFYEKVSVVHKKTAAAPRPQSAAAAA